MRIDMHIHTSYSPDGKLPPREVLKIARKRGLDAVAITDHNEIRGALEAKKLGIIKVIPGIEVSTSAGHVLAYHVDCKIPRGLSIAETAERIHECGGIAIIAHPYRFWSGVGEKEARKNFRYVDGLEIFNARCKERNNLKARKLWEELGGLYTAGSDAHFADEIGRAWLEVPCEDDVFECIRHGDAVPKGTSRTALGTARYVRKAVSEWIFRGFRKI